MYQKRKIDIMENNVKLFFEEYGNNKNLQPFVNEILESYLMHSLINVKGINPDCIKSLNELAEKIKGSWGDVLNMILSKYEFELTPTEKQKIMIGNDSNIKKRKKRRTGPESNFNPITDY